MSARDGDPGPVVEKRADDIVHGDRILGPVDGDRFPTGPLTVGLVSDYRRKGRRLGPRLRWVEPVQHLDARADRLYDVIESA